MTSEWIEIVNDGDIMYLNNMYDDFEDALIVSMNYISGPYNIRLLRRKLPQALYCKVVTIKFIVEKKAEGVLGFYKAG